MTTPTSSRLPAAAWKTATAGSVGTEVGRAEEGEAEARPTPSTRAERLLHMQRRLLEVHDAKLRRCWYCGEWAYSKDPCNVCTAPHNRLDLGETAS